MPTNFPTYLHHNWPLAAAAAVLALLVLYALLTGVLPTNQGRILRRVDAATYWRWMRRLTLLLGLVLTVIYATWRLSAG